MNIRLIIQVLFLISLPSWAIEIVSVQTASSNMVVVVIQMDTNYVDSIPNLKGWTVNDRIPAKIGRSSFPWDEDVWYDKWSGVHYEITMRHHIYLVLDTDLKKGVAYSVKTPYGNRSFVFDDRKIFCESIKVNQVGYNEKSTVRYANFGIFAGDLGSSKLANVPSYTVIDTLSKQSVAQGVLTFWGSDTIVDSTHTTTSGEHVYRIDLSNVPSGGPYQIVVNGMGVSYPFSIGKEYSKEIARVHLRGMYHQRCGIALKAPYTEFQRDACHTQVAFTKIPWASNQWITIPAGSVMHPIKGGYHDAADYDRRPMHTIIPILMLSFYEAFSDHFIDTQYTIPESGNGIPDFLDEALWGVLIWKNLQLDSTNTADTLEYGGVMMGTESNRHPQYGLERADTDKGVYGTFEIGAETTLEAVGMFAHASRLLKPYDLAQSQDYLRRAKLGWSYIKRNSSMATESNILYATLQLYLATVVGDGVIDKNNEYHLKFAELADKILLKGGKWPDQYVMGNTSCNLTASHFVSYLLTTNYKDTALANGIIKAMKGGVERGGYMGWTSEKYPYAQGVTKFMAWGAATAQGRYAEAPAYLYRLSATAAEKQKYFDMVSQLGDYSLGLNPLGKVFVTGLGTNKLQSPLHLDSWYTKYGKLPNGQSQKSIGNVPGIVIFGPSAFLSGAGYQGIINNRIYPSRSSLGLPGLRRWADGWSAVGTNEFSTWETMVWNVCMYSFLYDADAAAQISSNSQTPVSSSSENVVHESSDSDVTPIKNMTAEIRKASDWIRFSATATELHFTVAPEYSTNAYIAICDISGKSLFAQSVSKRSIANNAFLIDISAVPSGINFVVVNKQLIGSFIKL